MWQDHTISQANKTEKEEVTGQSFKKDRVTNIKELIPLGQLWL